MVAICNFSTAQYVVVDRVDSLFLHTHPDTLYTKKNNENGISRARVR